MKSISLPKKQGEFNKLPSALQQNLETQFLSSELAYPFVMWA